jgi:hypothetical protein
MPCTHYYIGTHERRVELLCQYKTFGHEREGKIVTEKFVCRKCRKVAWFPCEPVTKRPYQRTAVSVY